MPARWYRSLYWRIAIGLIICLAAMLVVQGVLLVFVASRSGPTLPGVPPARLARAVALELSQALARDPALDIDKYLREQHGGDAHPLFILLADGREFTNGGGRLPGSQRAALRLWLTTGGPDSRQNPEGPDDRPRVGLPRQRLGDGRKEPPTGSQSAGEPDGADVAERPGGRERGGGPMRPNRRFRAPRPARIIVNNDAVGVVIVPPVAPFGFLLARYAPTLAVVSVGALVLGAFLTTVLVFAPARRRLRDLESAAKRLGGGDLAARAATEGGDEVTAVAHAFNSMAEDLSARAEALATSDRSRRQLLADVSHELATPVTAMRGYLETLTMPDFPLDEATRSRYLGIVADETARLERIIGDLLELARLESGGGALTIADVPVADLFARVCARHERAARANGLAFTTEIAAGAETVRGDRERLEQALQNLAANALRYAPSGTAIELRARPHPAGVALLVIDHGAGIAPEHLAHLFDRFYKADASRTARGAGAEAVHGSGLGLSVVKAIIERHGGTVHVDSHAGRTAFQLVVPRPPAGATYTGES